jgi:hypothetical protein
MKKIILIIALIIPAWTATQITIPTTRELKKQLKSYFTAFKKTANCALADENCSDDEIMQAQILAGKIVLTSLIIAAMGKMFVSQFFEPIVEIEPFIKYEFETLPSDLLYKRAISMLLPEQKMIIEWIENNNFETLNFHFKKLKEPFIITKYFITAIEPLFTMYPDRALAFYNIVKGKERLVEYDYPETRMNLFEIFRLLKIIEKKKPFTRRLKLE